MNPLHATNFKRKCRSTWTLKLLEKFYTYSTWTRTKLLRRYLLRPPALFPSIAIKRITKWFLFRPFLHDTILLPLSFKFLIRAASVVFCFFVVRRKKNKVQEFGARLPEKVFQLMTDYMSGSDFEESLKVAVGDVKKQHLPSSSSFSFFFPLLFFLLHGTTTGN